MSFLGQYEHTLDSKNRLTIPAKFRAADKATFTFLESEVTKAFGAKIDDLKSVVLFLPKLKMPRDTEQLGEYIRPD